MNDAVIDDYLSWVDRETEKTMSDENDLTSRQTDLVVYEDETPPTIIQWANDPTQAWAMADALMSMHPNAKDVGIEGMRTVAQLALLTGANPLPGTNGIHVWRDKDGKICTSFGIGFWRNERDRAGGIVWAIPPRLMTDAERKQYGIGPGPIAAICAGALQSEIFSLLRKSYEYGVKMTYAEARESVAQFGIATVNANDYTKKSRPISWTALQSAERDLLRKLVPIGSRPPVYRDWSPKMVTGSNGGERPRLTLEEVNDELFGPELHPRRERTVTIEAAEKTEADEGEYEDEDQDESEVTTVQDFVEYALDRPGSTNVDFKEDRLLAWANFVTGDDYQHDFRWSLVQVLEDYCNAVADSNFKHTKEAAEAARTKYRRIVADIEAGVLEDE